MYQASDATDHVVDIRRPTFSLVRRCADAALAERDRWMLWTPVLLGLGIALYFALPAEPAPWTGALALAGVVAATAAIGRLWRSQRRPLLLAGIALGLIVAGFTAAQVRTHWVAAPVLSQRVGPIAVTGRVVGVDTFADGIRVTLAGAAARGRERVPPSVRMRLRGNQPTIRPGEDIRLRAMLMPPPAPAVPGGYDFQRQAYFEGFGAVGYSVGRATVLTRPTGGEECRRVVRSAALHCRRTGARAPQWRHCRRHNGAADRRATGDSGCDDAGDSRLRPCPSAVDLGPAHRAGRRHGVRRFAAPGPAVPQVALRFPIKKWAAPRGCRRRFYVLLADAPVPAERSFLMIAVVLLAVLVDRTAISMRLVAFAAW